jgi:hypothetical protein
MADAYICRRGGSGSGGGSELVIVGGTTSPAKADHNTIWLNTPNAITSSVLSATEPPNPVEGMAWITISASGPVKMSSPAGGNWVIVCPLTAKQYIGGAWVDRTAKSYQNGAWVDWIKYIIQNGVSELFTEHLRSGYSHLTKENGYIKVNSSGNYTCGGATSEKIDISAFSKLTMRCNVIRMSTYISLGIATSINNASEATTNSSIVAQTQTTKTGEQTITVNISEYPGSYYLCVKVDCGATSGDGEVHVYDMYLS